MVKYQAQMKKVSPKTYRRLEMIPGLLAWSIILLPLWGSFFFPRAVAYFVIGFLVFWFYQSFKAAILGIRGYFIIKNAQKTNWRSKYEKNKTKSWLEWEKIKHVVVIPNYDEPVSTLFNPLESLKNQKNLDLKQIVVVLAMEKRAANTQEKIKVLTKKYQNTFGKLMVTIHPEDIEGEIKGKASNEAWAAKEAKKELVDNLGWDINYLTISTCDADIKLHPRYLSALTYHFAKEENRHLLFWQSPIFWHNNLNRVPGPIKMIGVIGNVIHMTNLQEPDGMFFNYSTYSLSFKMLHDIGYWDTDIIPEDWHIFLQAFFAKEGKVKVSPIFLPTSIDAPEGKTYKEALKNRYLQAQRHAWGATDIPYAIVQARAHPEIPWSTKFLRVYKIIETHMIWSTNWFILTLGAFLPTIINPKFMQTSLGYNLPKFSQMILTACLLALLITIILDYSLRPKEIRAKGTKEKLGEITQWIFMPVATLFMAVLPGLDAHTRLMLGKRLEYKVTKKM